MSAAIALAVGVVGCAVSADVAHAQPGDALPAPGLFAAYDGRLVREVRIEGLQGVGEQLVRNNLRTRAGRPFDAAVVEEDLRQLYRLGRFSEITPFVEEHADGTVSVVFELVEAPIIDDVVVTGNRQINDEELAGVINLQAGVPVDEFQLGRAQRAIETL
ncbi:MAG: POTRA domain-containing protein [Planctomycetota bacterium]|nr:POTRA domain-containing protein [Planctomycetota bacterium]